MTKAELLKQAAELLNQLTTQVGVQWTVSPQNTALMQRGRPGVLEFDIAVAVVHFYLCAQRRNLDVTMQLQWVQGVLNSNNHLFSDRWEIHRNEILQSGATRLTLNEGLAIADDYCRVELQRLLAENVTESTVLPVVRLQEINTQLHEHIAALQQRLERTEDRLESLQAQYRNDMNRYSVCGQGIRSSY